MAQVQSQFINYIVNGTVTPPQEAVGRRESYLRLGYEKDWGQEQDWEQDQERQEARGTEARGHRLATSTR